MSGLIRSDICVEPAADLLARAHAAGHLELTARRLTRFHCEGVLPRPTQKHQSGAPGSVTLYPAGSTQQLLVLLALQKQHRKFADIAWSLWLLNWPVDDRWYKPLLQRAAKGFDRRFRQISEEREPGVDNGRELAEDLEAKIDKAVKNRVSGVAGEVKKRTGREGLKVMILQALRIPLGIYDAWSHSVVLSDAESKEMKGTFERAFPFGSEKNNGAYVVTAAQFDDFFDKLSAEFGGQTFRQLLDEADEQALRDARLEFMTVARFVANEYARAEMSGARVPQSLKFAVAFLEGLTTRQQARLFVIWLAVRRISAIRDRVWELIRRFREADEKATQCSAN